MLVNLKSSLLTRKGLQSPPTQVRTSPQQPESETALPNEAVTLSQAAKDTPESSQRKDLGFFSGGLAKTALTVGLVASLGMGMAGCTTMQTTCTPGYCVTQEVIDPVGTAAAVIGGAIILDNVMDEVPQNVHHGHHGHEHYHNHGNWQHSHPRGPNHHYGGHGYGGYGYGYGYGYGW